MAMSRRANNNARVSKRKGSRKGSKRVSRKGKKSSRKGSKRRGMLAKLMRKGKRSSRKSKGRKNNNVAVLVPVKGGQRGGTYPSKYPDNIPTQGDLKGAKRFAFAKTDEEWYSDGKASLGPTDITLEGDKKYKLYLVPISDLSKMTGNFRNRAGADITTDVKDINSYEEATA